MTTSTAEQLEPWATTGNGERVHFWPGEVPGRIPPENARAACGVIMHRAFRGKAGAAAWSQRLPDSWTCARCRGLA